MDRARENRIDIPICVAVFTLLIATTAVSARVYTRKWLLNQFGVDDGFAVAALLLVFACDFAVTYNINYGLGRHVDTLDKETIPKYLRTLYVSIVFYNAALTAIKLTFLSQFYRIFRHTSKTAIWVFSGVSLFVGCWALSQLLIAIFNCDPVAAYWDPTPGAICIGNHPFWEVNAAGNIVTDVLILTLPIPMLKRLNLPKRQRHILIGIFSLGVFTVCLSLIRIRFLKQYDDFTWENVEASGWSMGELAAGLTCACLPTLRPLVGRYAPWLSATHHAAYAARKSWGPSTAGDTERGGTPSAAFVTAPSPAHARRPSPPDQDDASPAPQRPAPVPLPGARVDSGGDNSDGIVGLQAARDAMLARATPVPAPAPTVGLVRPALERKGSSRLSIETGGRPALSVRSPSQDSVVRFATETNIIRSPTPLLSPPPSKGGN